MYLAGSSWYASGSTDCFKARWYAQVSSFNRDEAIFHTSVLYFSVDVVCLQQIRASTDPQQTSGYVITANVSRNTDLFVAHDFKSTASKPVKARKMGVRIISVSGFRALLQKIALPKTSRV
jgi:hypothetical protein